MTQTHRVYTFHNARTRTDVEFGPYLSEYEAKDAFQRRYGHWPAPAVYSQTWRGVKP